MNALTSTLLTAAALLAVGAIYLRHPLRAWKQYRGKRLVECPETSAAAAVIVDTGHAMLTAFIEGRPNVRLADCSRWPERGHCDEPCLADVESAGRAGTVEAIVGRWCRSRICPYCGKVIVASASPQYAPALLGPDGVSVAWTDVPAERLPDLFRTHQAVCCDCHLIETFRREHADLIVERPRA